MIEPIPKPAPSSLHAAPRGAIGTIHGDASPIFIHEPVLEAILDYSEQDLGRELGGFLLGGLHVDEAEYVEIRHFLPAVDVHSRAASLTFTHDTWAKMTRDIDEQFPRDVVLGWHHTHPNFGIFLSAYDLFIHRHFFSEPWQVALVVDPQRQEFGFFQWRHGEVVDCGFICIEEGTGIKD
jgi:proteasome lid subunit RPN8/RPN11